MLTAAVIRFYAPYVVKTKFDKQLKEYEHQMELVRLQKSLSYEHQREAFNSILVGIKGIIDDFESSYRAGSLAILPVSSEAYSKFEGICTSARLFLDQECNFAVDICSNEIARGAQDPIFDDPSDRDCRNALERTIYINRKLGELFHKKLGFIYSQDPFLDIVVLRAMIEINRFRQGPDFPTRGSLKLDGTESSQLIVDKGKENIKQLIAELKEFRSRLIDDEDSRRYSSHMLHELGVALNKLEP